MFMSKLKDLKGLDRDDLLDLVGLETKRHASDWVLPALGFFGVGLLVGAGMGLLLAPKAGAELRGDLRDRLQRANGHEEGAFPPSAGMAERPPTR